VCWPGESQYARLKWNRKCKQAGTLCTAATPKGQITEEISLQSPRAIHGECKSARLTLTFP